MGSQEVQVGWPYLTDVRIGANHKSGFYVHIIKDVKPGSKLLLARILALKEASASTRASSTWKASAWRPSKHHSFPAPAYMGSVERRRSRAASCC